MDSLTAAATGSLTSRATLLEVIAAWFASFDVEECYDVEPAKAYPLPGHQEAIAALTLNGALVVPIPSDERQYQDLPSAYGEQVRVVAYCDLDDTTLRWVSAQLSQQND
jgi:hypothetical protein